MTQDELTAFGETLGRSLDAPHAIAVSGELGAGKTTLIQAVCRGYGVTEPVTSPTFALVHSYRAPRSTVYHLDLYRLRDARDLTNIGWDDLVGERAVVLVEWPERAGTELPPDATRVALRHVQGRSDVRAVRATP